MVREMLRAKFVIQNFKFRLHFRGVHSKVLISSILCGGELRTVTFIINLSLSREVYDSGSEY